MFRISYRYQHRKPTRPVLLPRNDPYSSASHTGCRARVQRVTARWRRHNSQYNARGRQFPPTLQLCRASSLRFMTSSCTKDLPEEIISSYRANGFVRVPRVISTEEAADLREAALRLSASRKRAGKTLVGTRPEAIFTQLVNVWCDDTALRRLTLNTNLGGIAERLAGKPLRLWHDQLLIKEPHNQAATEFHQDQPYWPHARSPGSLSAWVALQDVPVERGCMTFLPRSHLRMDLAAQNLADAESFFSLDEEMRWRERVTLPLRAGDCTFHDSRCAHMATPNRTDAERVAHVIIFMDAETVYSGKPHVITDPLGLKEGDLLDGDMFPRVGQGGR